MGRKTHDKQGDYEAGPRVSRLSVALLQLENLLARLPDGSRCNVIFFDDEVRAWKSSVHRIDTRSRTELTAFINGTRAKGGTNLYDALELAMQDELCDTIYVLSDGQPTTGKVLQVDGIRRRLLQLNRRANIQFYCISIGLISELFIELAESTHGRYIELGISSAEAFKYARAILVKANAEEGELDRALQLSMEAVRVEPTSSLYRTSLGIALFRNGKFEASRKALEAAAGLKGSGDSVVRGMRVVFLARIEAREGEVERARGLLEEGRGLLEGARDVGGLVFLEWAEEEI